MNFLEKFTTPDSVAPTDVCSRIIWPYGFVNTDQNFWGLNQPRFVGKVVAPIDGKIGMVFGTKHAITMTSDSGIEILIHIGLDTVTLEGAPFTAHVEADQKVKAGDLMLEFDIEAIKAAGLDVTSPIVICNSDDYKEIKANAGQDVNTMDPVLTLVK